VVRTASLLPLLLLSLQGRPAAQEGTGFLARALELRKEGKIGRALEMVDRGLAQHPKAGKLLLLRGSLLFRLKRYEESAAAFRAAASAGAGPAAREGLALAALEAGRPAEALEGAASALEGGRRGYSLLLAGGRAALELGRPGESIPWFRRALMVRPAGVEARAFLARALLEAGRPGEAANTAREGIAALGPAPALIRTLAAALLETGGEEEAADDLEFLARTGKASPRDLAALGDLELRLGLPRRALVFYRAARAGGLEGKEQIHREALALWAAGELGKARALFLSLGPRTPPSWWVEIGRLRLAENDLEGAAGAFRKALEGDPESLEARLWLGRTALARGDLEGAERAFRLLLTRGKEKRAAYLGLARVWERRGDLREALAMLRRARAAAPGDPEILGRLLEVERALGEGEQP